ncbi:MAG: hypothetical protein Q9219_004321 [cf. Caloplaca sp. 3 TL-2023]
MTARQACLLSGTPFSWRRSGFQTSRLHTREEEARKYQATYQYQEEVEHLDGYHSGGYHPVNIGDVHFDGRYRIIHKLGFGTYSTVWLARDMHRGRNVALKIIVADASNYSAESAILRHPDEFIKSKYPANGLHSSLFATLLDEFHINGPNGRHLCLATEPTRCSVGESKLYRPFTFPFDIARAVAAQLILGVQVMYRSGIVHRDLHPQNILLSIPDRDSLFKDEIYRVLDKPRKVEFKRFDGAPLGPEAPSHAIWPAFTFISSTEVIDPRIRISDFGEARFGADLGTKQELNTPPAYLPPEAIFAKDQLSFPADIWTLACSLYEILGERGFLEGMVYDRDTALEQTIRYLGPLPPPWWRAWTAKPAFFEEDELWKGIAGETRPLSRRIQDMRSESGVGFSDCEADCLERMVGSMLKYEPKERATIEEVVRSEWMIEWGLPPLRQFGIVL